MWFGVFIFAALAFVELVFIKGHDVQGYTPTCDVTFFNWVPAIFLFILALNTECHINKEKLRLLRKTDDSVYIIHPLIRDALSYLSNEIVNLARFGIVLSVSFAISYFVVIFGKMRKKIS